MDEENQIIGYKFVNLGKMMTLIREGKEPNAAFTESTGIYGRFADAVRTIDPRKE